MNGYPNEITVMWVSVFAMFACAAYFVWSGRAAKPQAAHVALARITPAAPSGLAPLTSMAFFTSTAAPESVDVANEDTENKPSWSRADNRALAAALRDANIGWMTNDVAQWDHAKLCAKLWGITSAVQHLAYLAESDQIVQAVEIVEPVVNEALASWEIELLAALNPEPVAVWVTDTEPLHVEPVDVSLEIAIALDAAGLSKRGKHAGQPADETKPVVQHMAPKHALIVHRPCQGNVVERVSKIVRPCKRSALNGQSFCCGKHEQNASLPISTKADFVLA